MKSRSSPAGPGAHHQRLRPAAPAAPAGTRRLPGDLTIRASTASVAPTDRARGRQQAKDAGDHEVDLIFERDGGVLAIEVQLGQVPDDRNVRHLRRLEAQLGSHLPDSVVVTTGPAAYRRSDGIAAVPATLLGP
jgi:hypothetical protein